MTQEPVRESPGKHADLLSAPGGSVPSAGAHARSSGSGAAVRAADSNQEEKVSLGPYIPLYWDDLVGGTMSYGADEFGAYLLLLGYQWSEGAIENVPIIIERISRCEYSRLQRVLTKFSVHPDGKLRNARMEDIRNKRIAYVKSRKAAADARWNKTPDETPETLSGNHTDMHTHNHKDMRSGMHKGDIPFPSPSPYPKDIRIERGEGPGEGTSGAASSMSFESMIGTIRDHGVPIVPTLFMLTGESYSARADAFWKKAVTKLGHETVRRTAETLAAEMKAGEVRKPGACLTAKLKKQMENGAEAET